MHTFLSYSDLKCNLNHAIHMKTSKKMMIFSDFLLTLFFIFCGWNSKKAKYREILHFEKHSSLCNRFGKRTMFFVFSFFHFLCKFRISTSPLSVTKNEISTNFQSNFFGNIGQTWSFCWINANFSFKYYIWAISIIFIHLFLHFHLYIFSILIFFETQMLPSEGSRLIRLTF